MILRNSLLVSSILCNSECWYNVTESELDYLETLDLMLLRRILKTPNSTPKEMLYLELGCLPLRDIIQKRRLSYLHYILNEDSQSMIHRFFEVQLKNRIKTDWVSTVLEDLEKLKIKLSLDEIKSMKISAFNTLVNKSVIKNSFEKLEKLKNAHSKVKHITHNMLKMRRYFLPSETNASIEEIQLIFKLRCRVTKTKTNFKGLYDTYECDLCGEDDESQAHILECKKITNMNKSDLPDYDKIFEGTISEQVKIAKLFKQNMKIRDNMLEKD